MQTEGTESRTKEAVSDLVIREWLTLFEKINVQSCCRGLRSKWMVKTWGDILSQRGFLMTFIYVFVFWLCWVFIAAQTLVAAHGYLMAVAAFVAEHGLWGIRASVVSGPQALERRLRGCGAPV